MDVVLLGRVVSGVLEFVLRDHCSVQEAARRHDWDSALCRVCDAENVVLCGCS